MRRRTFLAGLGAGYPLLSGCGGSGADSSPGGTDSRTASPTPTPAPTGTPSELVTFAEGSGRIAPGSILDLETIPRTYVLSQQRYRGEEVLLRTNDQVTDRTVGFDSERSRYRVEGEAYELAVEEGQ